MQLSWSRTSASSPSKAPDSNRLPAPGPDLSSEYVLPGLIDCHTHLGNRADRYEEIDKFKDTPFDSAIAGVVNARTTLDAGFTTVRDVGSLPFLGGRSAQQHRRRITSPALAS